MPYLTVIGSQSQNWWSCIHTLYCKERNLKSHIWLVAVRDNLMVVNILLFSYQFCKPNPFLPFSEVINSEKISLKGEFVRFIVFGSRIGVQFWWLCDSYYRYVIRSVSLSLRMKTGLLPNFGIWKIKWFTKNYNYNKITYGKLTFNFNFKTHYFLYIFGLTSCLGISITFMYFS